MKQSEGSAHNVELYVCIDHIDSGAAAGPTLGQAGNFSQQPCLVDTWEFFVLATICQASLQPFFGF